MQACAFVPHTVVLTGGLLTCHCCVQQRLMAPPNTTWAQILAQVRLARLLACMPARPRRLPSWRAACLHAASLERGGRCGAASLAQPIVGACSLIRSRLAVQARADQEVLKRQDVIKSIQNVLQTNVSVCTSLGQPFLAQFNVIYADMLAVRCMLPAAPRMACRLPSDTRSLHAARFPFYGPLCACKRQLPCHACSCCQAWGVIGGATLGSHGWMDGYVPWPLGSVHGRVLRYTTMHGAAGHLTHKQREAAKPLALCGACEPMHACMHPSPA